MTDVVIFVVPAPSIRSRIAAGTWVLVGDVVLDSLPFKRYDLFEFAPIQPDTSTGGAHVKLHSGSVYGLHFGLAVWAHQQGHAGSLSSGFIVWPPLVSFGIEQCRHNASAYEKYS